MSNPKVTIEGVEFKACNCGCSEVVSNSRATYRPGHDARHASLVAKQIGEALDSDAAEGKVEANIQKMLGQLPSGALQEKADRIVQKRKGKKATRQAVVTSKVETKVEADGKVKVGRWTYPAKRDADGNVSRNTRRDGSGDMVYAHAEGFVAV